MADELANVEKATLLNDSPVVASYIVGIGASAGGLEAIEQFFDHMPSDSGLAFVIVQHLSPEFKSMMDELLARHTSMPIHRIENGMSVDANSIYLIPPKKNMVMSEGKLLLTDHDPSQGLNLPIDIFFRSLAQDAEDRAIAVVLSGTGSDGSRGVREVHEAGGLVVVQEEDSAKFDGMPRSAIATGVVDLELSPHLMPEALLDFLRQTRGASIESKHDLAENTGFAEIFALLRTRFSIDFAHYKPSTVGRRIERRITINRLGNLQDYVQQLHGDPLELDALYADLLIGVTEFFRDPPAFDLLRSDVIPQIIEHASPDNTVRVWVSGCATGEEAYSLAILLREEAERQERVLDIKIFATDVHQRSLERVSAAVYDASSMTNVPPELLERYFVHKDDRYYAVSELRQMVISANHNLVKDPPFTKIDLVSCRNLLIYLQPLAQRKALSFFHFALRTGGVLLLGPSETVNDLAPEFDTIDSRWRLYRKRRDVRLPDAGRLPISPAISMSTIVNRQSSGGSVADNTLQRIYHMVTEKFAPASILMNEQRQLVHVFGDARKYLQVPSGQVTVDLMKMIDGDLRLAMTSATHRAMKDKAPVVYRGIHIETEEGRKDIQLTVDPLTDRRTNSTFLLVRFDESNPPIDSTTTTDAERFDHRGESNERIIQLERELQYNKEHLQTTVEELETSNEELQSTNEEMVAANEELQSTNEELHSVNEELYTVNAEHQRKIDELTQLTNDMDNLLRSTEIGTVFVDTDLHIRKFTPAIATVINLLPQDIGRPIEHISHNIDLGEQPLLELVRTVLDSAAPIEREVHNRRGEPLLMRLLPYREETNAVAGVVLSFVDITTIKAIQDQLREADERLNLALRSAGVGTWDWNVGEDVVEWSNQMFPLFGVAPDEFGASYQAFLECVHPDDRQRVEAEVEAAVTGRAEYDTEFRVVWPDGTKRVIGTKGQVYNADGDKPARMTGICWDVTIRTEAAEARSRLAAIVESSHDAIIGKSLDGIVTSWNQAATDLYGYSPEEVIGRPVTILMPDDRPNEAMHLIEKVRNGERTERYRTVRKHKDGALLDVSLTESPIHDASGNVIGASSSARDITERIRAEAALHASHEKLGQMNEELRQFAYVASHDLREPLRTVRSFCELFDQHYKGQLDERADKWLGFMVGATSHMQLLIDDLLLYSRLETRAQAPEPTDCNKVMRKVIQMLDTSIQESQAEITFDKLPTVRAESTQLVQLFQNLISNSIKYRRESPRIHVSCEPESNGWKFSVRDNGIGIKDEFFSKVFELFKRLHARDKYSGTGIGLAVCRKIVQRHQGRIWLESKVGEGTTFHFTIPGQSNESDS